MIAISLLGQGGAPVAATGSSPGVTATLGPSAQLPQDYFGVNFDYLTVAAHASDPDRPAQLAALAPRTIRYPGGLEANSFDWQTGRPQKIVNGYQFTLRELWEAWVRTGPTPGTRAVPIFDLNLVTQSLADQIAMLQTARSMGMPIDYVELGNELYSHPGFSDGTAYGIRVAEDVKQLHLTFRGVKVGADAWLGHLDGPPPTQRERTWNQEMLTTAAQHGGSPDAVIIHAYPPPPEGNLTTANLPSLFVSSYREAELVQSVIDGLPAQAPAAAWLTEYNVHAGRAGLTKPPQRDYAHGLFVGEDSLLLERSPKATLSDFFTAFGGADFGAWSGADATPELSPQGLAFQWVAQAATGAETTAPIVFTNGPTLDHGRPALVGQAFWSGAARHAVILNLTDRTLTVGSGSALPEGASLEYVTGNPIAQVADAGALTHGAGTVGAEVTLQPYSITKIG